MATETSFPPEKREAFNKLTAATARSAAVLAIISCIGLLGIWLANATRFASDLNFEESRRWYYDVDQMLCRHRAYARQDSLFFQALTANVLATEFQDAGLKADLPCSDHGEIGLAAANWSKLPSGWDGSAGPGLSLTSRLQCFGDRVVDLTRTGKSDQREKLLVAATVACFSDMRSRARLREPQEIDNFMHVAERGYWPSIVWWIMRDRWPPSGISGWWAPRRSQASYNHTQHLVLAQRSSREQKLYGSIISDNNPQHVEQELSSVAESAFQAVLQSEEGSDMPAVSLPGIGSSLKADRTLILMGPLLFVFQIYFYLLWCQQQRAELQFNQGGESSAHELLARSFPRFSSPLDPLELKESATSIEERCGRALWLLFLISPTLILVAAVLFRYDLRILTPDIGDEYLKRGFYMREFVEYRSDDLLSLAIDGLNLLALAFSLVVIRDLTGWGGPGDSKNQAIKEFLVDVLSVGFMLLWVFRAHSVIMGGAVARALDLYVLGSVANCTVYLCFGLIWMRALTNAVVRKQMTLGVLALAGVVASFLILI